MHFPVSGDPYLDLLAVDSETSFEEQIPVSTTSCDGNAYEMDNCAQIRA